MNETHITGKIVKIGIQPPILYMSHNLNGTKQTIYNKEAQKRKFKIKQTHALLLIYVFRINLLVSITVKGKGGFHGEYRCSRLG